MEGEIRLLILLMLLFLHSKSKGVYKVTLIPGDYNALLAELNRITKGDFNFELDTSEMAVFCSFEQNNTTQPIQSLTHHHTKFLYLLVFWWKDHLVWTDWNWIFFFSNFRQRQTSLLKRKLVVANQRRNKCFSLFCSSRSHFELFCGMSISLIMNFSGDGNRQVNKRESVQ